MTAPVDEGSENDLEPAKVVMSERKKVRNYLDINGLRRNVERCRIMRKMTVI